MMLAGEVRDEVGFELIGARFEATCVLWERDELRITTALMLEDRALRLRLGPRWFAEDGSTMRACPTPGSTQANFTPLNSG